MRLLKVLTVILILASILIGIDYFTLSDSWLFYGWDMFFKSKQESSSVQNISPSKQPPSGKGTFPDSPYHFTKGWFTLHASDWENHLKELKGKPGIHALEIGNYEGLSAIWQIENILTDPTSTITCIDIFDEKEVEDRFDQNIEATGVAYKVNKLKGSSEIMLRGLGLEQYDYVYIDGCHLAKWVLSDAVLSWDLLKPGGVMIFDDYNYMPQPPQEYNPTGIRFLNVYLWRRTARGEWSRPAIDAFLKIYGPYLEVVFKKFQVVVRKKHEQ